MSLRKTATKISLILGLEHSPIAYCMEFQENIIGLVQPMVGKFPKISNSWNQPLDQMKEPGMR